MAVKAEAEKVSTEEAYNKILQPPELKKLINKMIKQLCRHTDF